MKLSISSLSSNRDGLLFIKESLLTSSIVLFLHDISFISTLSENLTFSYVTT